MATAHITNDVVFLFQADNTVIKLCAPRRCIRPCIQANGFFQTGRDCRCADWMCRISIPVENSAPFVGTFEHLRHFFAHKRGPNREISRRYAFGGAHHIGFDAPMATARPTACSTKTTDNLVSDHQNAMAVTYIPDQRHEGFMRNDDPAGPKDRLHNEGRNIFGALKLDLVFHCLGNDLGQAGRIGFIERVSIRVRRGHMVAASQ